jgi:hypothetical protein
VGKVYNLCKVKNYISAVLTVKSGSDPHMINKLEDELNRGPCLWFWICYLFYFLLMWVLVYTYTLVIRC